MPSFDSSGALSNRSPVFPNSNKGARRIVTTKYPPPANRCTSWSTISSRSFSEIPCATRNRCCV
jgi:hypothetical protein